MILSALAYASSQKGCAACCVDLPTYRSFFPLFQFSFKPSDTTPQKCKIYGENDALRDPGQPANKRRGGRSSLITPSKAAPGGQQAESVILFQRPPIPALKGFEVSGHVTSACYIMSTPPRNRGENTVIFRPVDNFLAVRSRGGNAQTRNKIKVV